MDKFYLSFDICKIIIKYTELKYCNECNLLLININNMITCGKCNKPFCFECAKKLDEGVVVTVFPDGGYRYLSGGIWW